MDKEKILEAARVEKNRGKEYENKEATRSSLLGSAIALLVGVALFLIEYCIKDSINVSLIAVWTTMAGVQSLYEGIKVKKLYLVIFGVVQLFIAVCAILIVIGQVVAV